MARFKPKSLPQRPSKTCFGHCPLFIASEGPQGGPTTFRFEKMWLEHKTFKDSVLSCWNQTQVNGWAAFRLQKKLQFIKQQLRSWNIEVFGSITQQKEALLHYLEWLDKK